MKVHSFQPGWLELGHESEVAETEIEFKGFQLVISKHGGKEVIGRGIRGVVGELPIEVFCCEDL